MQTLTQYLSNIMTTVLLGLPTEIKELIYFDALSHTATKILVRMLDAVKFLNLTTANSLFHYHQKSRKSTPMACQRLQ